MTGKNEDMRELAQLLTNGMSRLGEFLIQSAEEMREALEAPEEEESDEEDPDEEESDEEEEGEADGTGEEQPEKLLKPQKAESDVENQLEKSPGTGEPESTQS